MSLIQGGCDESPLRTRLNNRVERGGVFHHQIINEQDSDPATQSEIKLIKLVE
jgi:hypothetical protein